jgi:hypothetical protein
MSDPVVEMGLLLQAAMLNIASWALEKWIAFLEWAGRVLKWLGYD